MVARLPTELWAQILTTAIHVPFFFDTDPFEFLSPDLYPQYHWQSDYWTSERTRNASRRVCRLWNSILARYEHRFIQFQDVCFGKVPIAAVPKAYRMDFNICVQECTCERCSSQSFPRAPLTDTDIQAVCDRLSEETQDWNLQIFTEKVGNAPLCEFIISHAQHLGVLMSAGLHAFPQTNTTRSLRTLETWCDALQQTRLDHVSTLCIRMAPSPHNIDDLYLPQLRHLSIRQVSASLESLFPFLEKNGRNVITFRVHSWGKHQDIPSDIWTLLPNVESMKVPYRWGQIPPAHTKLRIVSISRIVPAVLLPGLASTSGLQGARWSSDGREWSGPQIRLDVTWTHLFLRHKEFPDALKIEEKYRVRGYALADADDTTLYDYLLFLIRFYWKRRAARSHLRCMHGRRTAYVF